MEIPQDIILELIPEGLPPDRYFVGQVGLLSESIEAEFLQRSFIWSSALLQGGLESSIPIPNRLTNVSSGFVYIDKHLRSQIRGAKEIEGFSFGTNILISSNEEKPQELRMLEMGNQVFPVVINYGKHEPHGLPPHPAGGSGNCWIKNNNSGNWTKGILTCRHTLSSTSLGTRIALSPSAYHSSPSSATLEDKDECTIDAAIVEIDPLDWPSGLSTLSICHAVAPGQSVSFEGRSSSQSGTVLRVFQHSGYIGNLFGQRVFTDCSGLSGDSGSLLVDQHSGDGVGIYMGTVPDGAGGHEGLFQHLSQAATYFDFSTFI